MPELDQKLPNYGDSGMEAEILGRGCRGSQAERGLCCLHRSTGGMEGGTQRATCPLPGTSRLSACALSSACQGVAHLVLPLAVTMPLLLFRPKVRQDQAVTEGDHECAVRVVHEPHCGEFHHQPSSAGKALCNGRHVTGFIFVWNI